jgi:DNA-binding IclR family transcriptional regulator
MECWNIGLFPSLHSSIIPLLLYALCPMRSAAFREVAQLKKEQKKTKSEYTGLVPAVDQASRILLCLAKGPALKMNLTEICKNVGIHKSKGYSILNTLQRYGFVRKDQTEKTYSLGLGLISLSRKVLDNLNYGQAAAPFLRTLAGKAHSTALFGLLEEDNAFVVAKHESDQKIGITTRVGHRFGVTDGASGKAIFAFLPEEERERIRAAKRPLFHGHESRFDEKRLEKEMAECRRTGYAVDLGEVFEGINIIAAPAFDSHGSLLGSIFIMGTFPESLVADYGPVVAETAKQFSAYLGADVEKIYNGR